MNGSSHPNDENLMKKNEHKRPRPYPSRSLWGRYGPGAPAQWSRACGCDNAFAGTQCGTLWADELLTGYFIKNRIEAGTGVSCAGVAAGIASAM